MSELRNLMLMLMRHTKKARTLSKGRRAGKVRGRIAPIKFKERKEFGRLDSQRKAAKEGRQIRAMWQKVQAVRTYGGG